MLPASARSVVLTGLRAGDPYRFSVAARNVLTAPARRRPQRAPSRSQSRTSVTRLRVEVRRKAALVVWRAPESSGSRVTRYTVMASNGKKVSVGSDRRRVRVTGLKTGRKLAFRVVATNSLGDGPCVALDAEGDHSLTLRSRDRESILGTS